MDAYRDKYFARLEDLLAAEHKIHEQLDEITQLHEMLNGANARIAQLEGLLRQSLAAGTSSLGMDERAGTQGGSDKDQAEAPPPEKKVKVEPGSLVVFSGPPSSANQSTTSDAHLSPSTGPLVSWTQIVKDGWPGTITSFQASQKKRIDDSVKEFLTEKGLSQSQISQCVVFEGLKVQKPVAAVPVNYIEEFTSWFTRKIDEGMLHLSNLRRKGGKGAKTDVNVLVQEGGLMLWRDLVNTRFRSEMDAISGQRDYSRRVRTGVEKFIHDNCGAAGKKEDECYVRKIGSAKRILAIPVLIQDRFLEWFEKHLNNCFWDYETSAGILAFQKSGLKDELNELESEEDE